MDRMLDCPRQSLRRVVTVLVATFHMMPGTPALLPGAAVLRDAKREPREQFPDAAERTAQQDGSRD